MLLIYPRARGQQAVSPAAAERKAPPMPPAAHSHPGGIFDRRLIRYGRRISSSSPQFLCALALIMFAHCALADLPFGPTGLPITDTTNLLVAAEYFWDNPTNGVVPVNISSNETFSIGDPTAILFSVSITNLSAGLHQFGFR